MELMIPEDHHEMIVFINNLSSDEVKELSSIFDSAPITFSVTHLSEYLYDCGFKNLASHEIYDLVDLLVSLHYIRHDNYLSYDLVEFIGAIVVSAVEFIDSDINRDQLFRNLECLLGESNSILITAKALNVMTDYEHVYRSARVITDARHVFSDDSDEKSLAVMVTHMLKIEHDTNEGQESIFLAMDSNDIRKLQKVLDRALRKESELKRISKESEVPFLDSAYLDV